MQPTLCARCGVNPAVLFITKIENGQAKNEGLCLKCARQAHIKPVDDIISKMGLSDEEMDNLSDDMASMMEAGEALMNQAAGQENSDDPDSPDAGKTATFPFLSKIMGQARAENQSPVPADSANQNQGEGTRTQVPPAGARKAKHKFLDAYCIDLTGRAREGKLDSMIGREEELIRVIQILNRRQKNNPCLIGEPGVGKTAIAEGLAQRIVSGQVPYKLKEKQVYMLDLTSLVAGTQFRGQFEGRMKGLIQEIIKEGNVILFIDELHNIIGAGDAEGSMNAANILKPALSRGEIQVIGATTFTEYRKHIEKDTALERRFQPVTVNEPSIEDSVKILTGISHYYEDYHGVAVGEDMCRLAVTLSERYITDRFLPDKAIDLIDEACSDLNLRNPDIARMDVLRKDMADLDKEKELLMQDAQNMNYERLAEIRAEHIRLEDELLQIQVKGRPRLTEDNLARIIELWTKIPASSIRSDEMERLAGMAERLRANIIGQDEAIDAVCSAVKRSRVGLQAKRKPCSFIFAGPTGVGKTELVKRLAADLFDTPDSLIRVDMTEFMERHTVARLVGSPPGYVGYDEAGQLTEKVRRRPYSVVLFDEIEKAHPDVMNILMQILDDGRITDAQGRVVNFENTVIVMTTNAGSSTRSGGLGFGMTATEQAKDRAMKALGEFLRPEFLNRVDEIICFNSLSPENFRSIARLMLEELRSVMEQKGYSLRYDDAVVNDLAERSCSETYGARNLRRLIQKDVEDAIAAEIVDKRSQAKNIALSAENGRIIIASC